MGVYTFCRQLHVWESTLLYTFTCMGVYTFVELPVWESTHFVELPLGVYAFADSCRYGSLHICRQLTCMRVCTFVDSYLYGSLRTLP
jgi:hypothetical protein